MSYVLDQVFPVPPPPPEPSQEEVEKQTDTMYSSALANHSPDSERQAAARSPLLVSPFRRRSLRRVCAVARDAHY